MPLRFLSQVVKRTRLPSAEMWKAVDGEGFEGGPWSLGYAEFEL